jgi:hypothetical protein
VVVAKASYRLYIPENKNEIANNTTSLAAIKDNVTECQIESTEVETDDKDGVQKRRLMIKRGYRRGDL